MSEGLSKLRDIIWDNSKPNGTLRKVMNISKLNDLGWSHKNTLRVGIEKTLRCIKNTSALDNIHA